MDFEFVLKLLKNDYRSGENELRSFNYCSLSTVIGFDGGKNEVLFCSNLKGFFDVDLVWEKRVKKINPPLS